MHSRKFKFTSANQFKKGGGFYEGNGENEGETLRDVSNSVDAGSEASGKISCEIDDAIRNLDSAKLTSLINGSANFLSPGGPLAKWFSETCCKANAKNQTALKSAAEKVQKLVAMFCEIKAKSYEDSGIILLAHCLRDNVHECSVSELDLLEKYGSKLAKLKQVAIAMNKIKNRRHSSSSENAGTDWPNAKPNSKPNAKSNARREKPRRDNFEKIILDKDSLQNFSFSEQQYENDVTKANEKAKALKAIEKEQKHSISEKALSKVVSVDFIDSKLRRTTYANLKFEKEETQIESEAGGDNSTKQIEAKDLFNNSSGSKSQNSSEYKKFGLLHSIIKLAARV